MSGSPLPTTPARFEPRSCALILIDLQRYDADPECGIGPGFMKERPELATDYFRSVRERVVPNALRLLEAFRQASGLVVYTASGATLPDGADLTRRRRERFTGAADGRRSIFHRSEPEYELLSAFEPVQGEVLLHKNTVSAFNSTALDRLLRNAGASTVVVAGVVTDGCVDSTARDAADLGYESVIAMDACAAWRVDWHDQALACFARYWGSIASTDEILAALRGPSMKG